MIGMQRPVCWIAILEVSGHESVQVESLAEGGVPARSAASPRSPWSRCLVKRRRSFDEVEERDRQERGRRGAAAPQSAP